MDIPALLLRSASDRQDQLAIVSANNRYTYADILHVAAYIQTLAKPGVAVGVISSPSAMMGLLSSAVVMSGCPVVPIDPALPASVVENIIDELGLTLIFTDGKDYGKNTQCIDGRTAIETALAQQGTVTPVEVDPCSAIYIVSTSGTTGKPKCIPVSQSSATLSYAWREQEVGAQPGEKVCIYIFAIWELLRPLVQGGCTYFPHVDELMTLNKLTAFLTENEIDEVLFTPSFIERAIDASSNAQTNFCPSLKRILLNGEVVSSACLQKLRQHFPHSQIWSLYSICEAHDISINNITGLDVSDGKVSSAVGVPMPELTAWILDDNDQPLPQGEVGEIYLVGDKMLGEGYINRPEETNKRFFELSIHGEMKRVYKSGDQGKISADGQLHVLGRIAHMLKLNGYSIQTDELVHSMSSAMQFAHAVPWIKEISGRPTLVFYYTASEEQLHQNLLDLSLSSDVSRMPLDFRNTLKAELPSYCIPDVLYHLDKMPVNPASGKYDYKALPVPNIDIASAADFAELKTWDHFLQLIATQLKLAPDAIDTELSLVDHAADSLDMVALLGDFNKFWSRDLDFSDLPTISIKLLFDKLDENEATETTVEQSIQQAPGVLLTGATGYLGKGLLKQLANSCEKGHVIYCLIRPNEQSAEQRLSDLVTELGIDAARVQAIAGDIRDQTLGLSKENYIQLAKNVYSVIHSASLVNLTLDKAFLEKTVVEGGHHIINFCHASAAQLHFVSTSAVFPDQGGPYPESLISNPQVTSGYGLTKIAVERDISENLSDYSIYRIPSVTDADTPNDADVYERIKQLSLAHGVFPTPFCTQLVQLHEVAALIAGAALNGRQDGVLNVMPNFYLSDKSMSQFEGIEQALEKLPYDQWLKRVGADDALSDYLSEHATNFDMNASFVNGNAQRVYKALTECDLDAVGVSDEQWLPTLVKE
ncbi:NAD-dependent epimerase/dehydratase family protein [Leucothrix sargassi]|nr:NAD-dependent epimerase/dehydratase family protein [Leucothrix sargassi]